MKFEYSLYREDARIEAGSSDWERPLPLTREAAIAAGASPGSQSAVPLGAYFHGARAFLKARGVSRLMAVRARKHGSAVQSPDIHTVRICLKKHGEFYHPAKISFVGDREAESFVLNVAVSDPGKRILFKEVQSLKRLEGRHPISFVPRVYGAGTVSTWAGRFALFLGDWFDGFHEFHLFPETPPRRAGIRVWDETHGPFSLNRRQTQHLYRQVAYILTAYYDPVTFEEIHPWHHAAGDFVIQKDATGIQVRLVTVRGVRSMFHRRVGETANRASPQFILDALLLFFLNLTCRIRLDRASGTGEWIWADEDSVAAAVGGFFLALGEKAALPVLPAPLADCFTAYLLSMTRQDILELLTAVVMHRFPSKHEAEFVARHMEDHADRLVAAVKKQIRSP